MLYTVAVSCGEKLSSANHAQRTVLLRANCILAALSARNRKKANLRAEAMGKVREQAGVFVVRMGGDI